MKKLKVLITGIGAPGIGGTIYSLNNNFDKRRIEIIGTDVNPDVVGKYLCTKNYKIESASNPSNYLDSLFKVCKKERPDIILPQNTAELITLSSNKVDFYNIGTSVIISDTNVLTKANNKFNLLEICNKNNIPTLKYKLVNNFKELKENAIDLGWPERKIVVKPPDSNGMRGVRVIDERINLKKQFFEEKPTSFYITLDDLFRNIGNEFPDLIISEYLPGDEYSVDVLRTRSNLTVIPRKRSMIRSGITFNGKIEKNEKIISISEKLAEILGLSFCFGFQFKSDENNHPQILECNPRVQGTMVMSTICGANIIYGSIKAILNEEIPDFNIDWNSVFYRYWGGVGINQKEIIFI
jgi:carbamoyl-phosphate synthase large subunit